MRVGVISFPGSNCDRDMRVALQAITGQAPLALWHQAQDFPALDLIVLPGGFSYGDYLRCGAIAARSPIMQEVIRRAQKGVALLGVCNGFQILLEAGLLPGSLLRNEGLNFICQDCQIQIANPESPYTKAYDKKQITLPIAHHDGNYYASADTLERLEGEGRVIFRYRDNINGSQNKIAGISSQNGRILGLMPHPERAVDPALGLTDGRALFQSILKAL